MKRDYFIGLESHNNFYSLSLAEVIDHIYFDEYGLILVITQDAGKKDIQHLSPNRCVRKQTASSIRVRKMRYAISLLLLHC